MLSFSGCTKDVPVTKDAAVYELIFTDVDGIVYHSSEILADMPEDSVCEGIYYKGGKCFIEKEEYEALVKDVYAQVTDEFNGEYGYEIGTYAFVPINGFDNGDGVKSENDREVIDILPDVCRKECMRVFKEVCDKWSKYDAQGETFDKDSTWRTLSADEWSYLVDNHNKKWTTVCGTKGLAIAPDGVPASALADSYQSNAWKDAENAGIIFLPDTGVRHSTGTSEIGMCGYFWSSTLFTWDECAFYLSLSNNKDAATQYHKRKFGCGVRLVTEAK